MAMVPRWALPWALCSALTPAVAQESPVQYVTRYALLPSPSSSSLRSHGDVDGDGIGDVVYQARLDRYLLSARDGGVLRVFPSSLPSAPITPLGDIDGDGVADTLLGENGDVVVYAGRTGAEIWRVPVPARSALWFGTGVEALDDVDGDGIGDVGAAFDFDDWTVEQRVISGADGRTVSSATFSVPTFVRGSFTALADIDADGVRDHTWDWTGGIYPAQPINTVYSARTGQVLRQHNGYVSRLEYDFDGDGAAEYLYSPYYHHTRPMPMVQLISGATGAVLHTWQGVQSGNSAGDANGDGVEDVVASERGVNASLTVFSGASLERLWQRAWAPFLASYGAGLDDIDGDGRSELHVSLDCSSAACRTSPSDHVLFSTSLDFASSTTAGSVAQANQATLSLAAPAAHAGKTYWILGSLSGTAPGIVIGDSTVPLVPDPYTIFTASHPASGLLTGAVGTLDPLGRATAALRIPTLTPAQVGVTIQHAYVVLGARGIEYASRSAPFALLR